MTHRIVGVIPPGVPLTAAGEILRGFGAAYPAEGLRMANASDGGLHILYDPDSAADVMPDPAPYEVAAGTADEETYTVPDGELLTFALNADDDEQSAAIAAMGVWMRHQLDRLGAPNYLAFTFRHPDGARFAMTIQRVNGPTPAEKIAALQIERDELQQRITTLEYELEEAINRDA